MATSKSTTAKKPVAKKTTVTSKTTAKTATTKKPATTVKKPAAKVSKPAAPVAAKKQAAPAKTSAPTPEQRYKMVQDAAYFIAEKNGFQAGSMDYWIAAEAEITALLSGKKK
jgi:hypothetical protein